MKDGSIPLDELYYYMEDMIGPTDKLETALAKVAWVKIMPGERSVSFLIDEIAEDAVNIDHDDEEDIETLIEYLDGSENGCEICHLLNHWCGKTKGKFKGSKRNQRFIRWISKYPELFSCKPYQKSWLVKYIGNENLVMNLKKRERDPGINDDLEGAVDILLERASRWVRDHLRDMAETSAIEAMEKMQGFEMNAVSWRKETPSSLCNSFVPCHITNIEKIFVGCLHNETKQFQRLTKDPANVKSPSKFNYAQRSLKQRMCVDFCIAGFAWLLHLALHRYYGQDEDYELLETSFDYPGLTERFTLNRLMFSADDCLVFLQSLWSLQARQHGSVYFYQYGGKKDKTKLSPWAYIADGNWKLILPYGIVNALVHDARAEISRENSATKYLIRIPVWYEGSWHYYDDLALDANSSGRSEEGPQRKRRKGLDNHTSNCLAVVPFSARYEFRANRGGVGRSIAEYAQTMDQLESTAFRTEKWWKDELSELVGDEISEI